MYNVSILTVCKTVQNVARGLTILLCLVPHFANYVECRYAKCLLWSVISPSGATSSVIVLIVMAPMVLLHLQSTLSSFEVSVCQIFEFIKFLLFLKTYLGVSLAPTTQRVLSLLVPPGPNVIKVITVVIYDCSQ
jgi:hypothetical protein